MSEEEKKAIEYLTKWVHWETAGERNLETDIETVLNLIDKQKEEIKEEKEKWKELFHEYNKLVGEVIDKEQDLKDSISKDKIQDKIEQLERYYDSSKETTPTSTNQFIIDVVAILEELLEGGAK